MSTYEARKTSFLQKEAASGPSRKKGAAAISKLSWPHPFTKRSNDRSKGSSSDDGKANKVEDAYPSPRSLANLGLYYDPTTEEDDRCTVYPDGHSISGWRRGQSALERLEEEDPLISWVMIERSKRASEAMTAKDDGKLAWTRQAESMYPTGKVMNDARWRTYGGAWPLDGKKGWKPTSKKVSLIEVAYAICTHGTTYCNSLRLLGFTLRQMTTKKTVSLAYTANARLVVGKRVTTQ
jgi:hypothetical protein